MPRPCASLTPNRIDRNADARNVVYSDRSSDRGSDALVDQVLEGEESRDVRLRFFERAVGFLQFLPDRRLAPADRDAVRPQPMHQLVHDDVREERLEREVTPDRPNRGRPSKSAAEFWRTSRPGRSSA